MNAMAKAGSVHWRPGDIVIGADTIVLCDGRVLGKPADRDEAKVMLGLQLNNLQQVVTGVAVVDPSKGRKVSGYEVSTVMLEGDIGDIERYLDTGSWEGKAGAFGLQDDGPIRARLVSGRPDNVIGLPMTLVHRLLRLVGHPYDEKTPGEGQSGRR